MTRSPSLVALAAALFLVAAITPALPDDSPLPAEFERLSKQMEMQIRIRQISIQTLKLVRNKALLYLKKTTLWRRHHEREAGWTDIHVELVTLREQFELVLFRQRMKEDLSAILKRPITEDDISRWYADAAARLAR